MIFRKDIDIPIDENIIKKKKIPVLTKNREWKQIIEESKNRNIKSLSNNLEKMVAEEKELRKKLKLYNQEKRTLINKILHLSDLLNSKGQEEVLPKLERSKEEINRLNEDIDKLLEEVQDYPREIEKLNLELLKETIKITYREMIANNDTLKVVDEEINKLRSKLGELIDEKIVLEEKIQRSYSFLHDTVGHEEMEKLDIKFLKYDDQENRDD
ncbi:MAG: hypothetical protein GX214_00140 [Clostridiales bacterium]|nr:hypothetical protein [Clostridiales bacterium]